MRTRSVVLFDGHCVFCTAQAARLAKLAGPRVELRDFQNADALDGLPLLAFDDLMREMHVVAPDDRVFAGAEAVARSLALTPVVGPLAFLYYVPGLRQLANYGYAAVAKRRYRIAGETCADGTCKLHADYYAGKKPTPSASRVS